MLTVAWATDMSKADAHLCTPGDSGTQPVARTGRGREIGVYEKALAPFQSWRECFQQVSAAGFDFLELAVDEDPGRIERLDWAASACSEVARAARRCGVGVGTVMLSAHRSCPLGSPDPEVRSRARRMLLDAVALAERLGAPLVQVAGYFVFSGPRSPDARRWFVDGVRMGAATARRRGVTLAIENMDGRDILSIADALGVIEEIGDDSGVLVYPDIGNLAANGLDVCAELRLAAGRTAAVQLKDSLPGVFRRVAFGDGVVPFAAALSTLDRIGFDGPLSIEMWNDAGDPSAARAARSWLEGLIGRCPPDG